MIDPHNALIVISGVAGMTGSLVARKLLDRGYSVIGFDNFFAGSRSDVAALKEYSRFTFHEYDINDREEMDRLFKGLDESPRKELHFINCAAVVHTTHFYEIEATFATNVLAMKDMLTRCITHRFVSYINCRTSEVYSMDSYKEGGVREDMPVLVATAEQSQRTSYAVGKLLTEFMMKDRVAKGLILGCSIRFANVYSPSELHDQHIIPHIITSLIEHDEVTLLEHAKETQRTFLHNDDSAEAVIALLMTPSALDGSVYNVGTTEEIAIPHLVEKIGAMLGNPKPRIRYQGSRSADPRRRMLNCNKLMEATGWRPKKTLDAGLAECIAYRQGNRR